MSSFTQPSMSLRLEESDAARIPLVVDVDGTLIKSDLLHESALQFIARHPLQIWKMALWLLQFGKAGLKARLAQFMGPVIPTVPLRHETVALIHIAQMEGREVFLASASDLRLVKHLAERIGAITNSFGSDGQMNLAGKAKADRLVAEFGFRGFDYLGDGLVDIPVWQVANRVLVVSHGKRPERRLLALFPNATIVARTQSGAKELVRALRPHQWAKNALVFVGLVAGHHFAAPDILMSIMAFVAFSMAASSAYVVNDLLDLPGDRSNARKASRPFASGNLPIKSGAILSIILCIGAFLVSASISLRFTGVLAIYIASTVAYSTILKRKLVIDIVVLGCLYAIRVLGGMVAIDLPQAPWLLMFSLFLFSSLAIAKRCSELIVVLGNESKRIIGRGYRSEDLSVLISCGTAAGYASVLVFALYLSSSEVQDLYRYPSRLWLICPLLLYWISRVFILSNRNELHDDPVVFALTDRNSLIAGLCAAAVLIASI